MANYGFLTRLIAIFSGKCHPSAWCVAVSSGKVVIYRISLMIRGCQKRRLDESSTSPVPVILHALYEMAHNLRGSRDQFFSRWTGHGESHHKWLEESYRLNDFCHQWSRQRRNIRKEPFFNSERTFRWSIDMKRLFNCQFSIDLAIFEFLLFSRFDISKGPSNSTCVQKSNESWGLTVTPLQNDQNRIFCSWRTVIMVGIWQRWNISDARPSSSNVFQNK